MAATNRVIFGVAIILLWTGFCCAYNPISLIESGVKSLLDKEDIQSGISSFFGKTFALGNDDQESNVTSTQEETDDLLKYGKPMADKSSVLDSLFEINAKEFEDYHVFSDSQNETQNKEEELQMNSITSIFHNIDFLPLVSKGRSQDVHISQKDKPLLNFLDKVRKDAWLHFKNIITSYLSVLDTPGSDGFKAKNSFPVKMFMKLLDMGDKVNIIHMLGKKVDPEMAKSLYTKLKSVAPGFLGLKNITNENINQVIPPINSLINNFAWMSIRHIINNLMERIDASYTKNELENYVTTLENANPFAAKGLKFVLSLPETNLQYDEEGEGRSLYRRRGQSSRDRDAYGYEDDGYGYLEDGYGYSDDGYSSKDIGYEGKDGGYGHSGYDDHSGGYGHGSGYKMNIYLDPYLILAGIGTAALLAFVAFRILTTTAAAGGVAVRDSLSRGTRDVDFISSVLNSIESGDKLYGEDNDVITETEDFISGVNDLWRGAKEEGCKRCVLFNLLSEKTLKRSNLKLILLSAVSQLLGADRPAQLLDEVTQNLVCGSKSVCEQDGQSCVIRRR